MTDETLRNLKAPTDAEILKKTGWSQTPVPGDGPEFHDAWERCRLGLEPNDPLPNGRRQRREGEPA